jgi:hypothetical protein
MKEGVYLKTRRLWSEMEPVAVGLAVAGDERRGRPRRSCTAGRLHVHDTGRAEREIRQPFTT